jgi:F0F1-type ATP synthase membrane subunit c/vacuolar-type H+-ATPase subunit K
MADGKPKGAAQSEPPKTQPVGSDGAGGGPHKGLVIAGIAASVTAIGLGVGFAVASNAEAADAEEQRTAFIKRGEPYPCLTDAPPKECAEHSDTISAQGTLANASVVSFVMGGVLGATTAIYALVVPSSKQTNHVRAVPVATRRGGGLVIAGSW